jgi:hypothetical protein
MLARAAKERLCRNLERAAADAAVGKLVERRAGAIRDRVVLARLVVPSLLGDLLEALLFLSVGVADLKWQTLLTEKLSVELGNDIVALLAIFEARLSTRYKVQADRARENTYRANPTPLLFPLSSRWIRLDSTV